jgi:HPt (histidine-containing phosphotransfer) domain-containing protein
MRIRHSGSEVAPEPTDANGDQARAFNLQFEALRKRFRERIRDDHAALTRYRMNLHPPSSELRSIVHRLAGTAGMVDFMEIAAAAGQLDDGFIDPKTDLKMGFDDLLRALERAIAGE